MAGKGRRGYKVRYDRIISVLFAVVLIIYAGIMVFNSCRKNSGPEETAPEPEVFEPVVYLSPSNQRDNVYAAGDVTEGEVMRAIGELVKKDLESSGVTVYMADENDSLKEKVEFSNQKEITAHVAIHSNAGGTSGGGEGTECFYNPKISGSKELAEDVYTRVSRLTPTEDRGIKDGSTGSTYLYEIAMTSAANCLVEIEFHDSAELARWIIENEENIARTIASGIMEYLDFAREEFEKNVESGYEENGE